MNQGYQSVLCISKGNLTLQANMVNCELIAVIQHYWGKLKIMDWVWLIYTFNEAALL